MHDRLRSTFNPFNPFPFDPFEIKHYSNRSTHKLPELMMRSARMYQEYMKQIPIPAQRGSVITFTSWSGLAKSMKQLYQQPLHYLTNVRLKEWDQLRSDADIKAEPLDTIIHPCKAVTNIWLMEEVHRLTSSYQFLAKLWLADPMYNAFIDSVFPQL